MRIFVSIIFIVLLSASFKHDDTMYVYQQTLQRYLANSKADTLYILKCFDIELPTKVGKCSIIDIENSEKNWVKEKGSIYAVKVMPINLSKGNIEVTLVEYHISEENNERLLKNSGSQTFIYKYNVSKNQYQFVRKTNASI